MSAHHNTVGLFVTCLVDLQRPSVGFAALKLLQAAGCNVSVPDTQTCCGQPAWNSGDRRGAQRVARTLIDAFEGCDQVVAPSGSCAGMVHEHYPELFKDDPLWRERAEALAARTYELTSFLIDVLKVDPAALISSRFEHRVCYHDSCAGLRELGVKQQPRQLMAEVDGLQLDEMHQTEVCCGFGGTFCVKYPDISTAMADDKLALAEQSGASYLLGGDLGCLLHLAGRARRQQRNLHVLHVAEVLAGEGDVAPIGEARQDIQAQRVSPDA